MPEEIQNKTLLVHRPNSDQVMLVVAVINDPESLDVEKLLAGMVPEMARGGVRGGLLVLGDSCLVLRNMGQEIAVDEVDTSELLALADLDTGWSRETLVEVLQDWIGVMAGSWRDRLVGRLREVLVPHLVAGLGGDVELVDGVWGQSAHRVADVS
jgi:hypothetical protein